MQRHAYVRQRRRSLAHKCALTSEIPRAAGGRWARGTGAGAHAGAGGGTELLGGAPLWLLLFAFFAAHRFMRVFDPLALVGLGRAVCPDLSRDLPDALAIGTADRDLG